MRMMKQIAAAFALLALTAGPAAPPADAALRQGARAPDFTAQGSIGGRPFLMRLSQQLRSGPVVLYFYPRAFTEGCTLEAHAFSEATAEFRQLGASVVGLSADDSETLRRFSVEGCRSAFPVATATPQMIDAYDARLRAGAPMTNRTSYVIAPDGRILAVHSEMDWRGHVNAALTAVRAWRARNPRR